VTLTHVVLELSVLPQEPLELPAPVLQELLVREGKDAREESALRTGTAMPVRLAAITTVWIPVTLAPAVPLTSAEL